MIRFIFLLVFLVTPGLGAEDLKTMGNLNVTIHGFVNQNGILRVSVYKNREGFPSDSQKAFLKKNLPIKNDPVTVEFLSLPFGIYAVSVHHDLNQNLMLDKNVLGIPKEPIAVSNNPKIQYGPPSFKTAQFSFDAPEKTIFIQLPQK